jgi:two-component system, NarL family, nitrate/nitrite response regulator NarL
MSEPLNPGQIRVMLVDDHRSLLWGLQRLIDGEKPRMTVVATASTPAEALQHAAAQAIDVILLDLDLGAHSGLDAIPLLRAACKARVLVLTGMRDPAVHDRAVLAGACGILNKEEKAEMILRAIERAYMGELWLDRAATGRIFVELSRRTGAAPAENDAVDRISSLTPRERDIVIAMASDAGARTRAIAAKLHISEHTLRNHLTSIYDKLGVSTRLELWAYAHEHGLNRLSA